MKVGVVKPTRIRTGQAIVDAALEQHARSGRQVSESPIVGGLDIYDITIPNNTTVVVNHGLGRKYKAVFVSCVERVAGAGNGTVEVIRQGDRNKQIHLRATGYGGAVIVAVWVI